MHPSVLLICLLPHCSEGKVTTRLDGTLDILISLLSASLIVAIFHYHPHMMFTSQLIQYVRACNAYDQFLKRGRLLVSLCYRGRQFRLLKSDVRNLQSFTNTTSQCCLICFKPIIRQFLAVSGTLI
jgi:hypothetical protein